MLEKLTPRKAANYAWAMLLVLVVCLAFDAVFLAAVATLTAGLLMGFALGFEERGRRDRDAQGK